MHSNCSAVAPVPALLAAYALASSLSHIAITSPRLGNATPRVAAVATAAVVAIAIIGNCQHRGAMQRRMQPTTHYYDPPVRMPVLSLLRPIIMTRKRYTSRAHSTDAIVEDHARASELANAT